MKKLLIIVFILLSTPILYSDEIVTLKNGKSVLLKDNGTWSYVKESTKSQISKGIKQGASINCNLNLRFSPDKKSKVVSKLTHKTSIYPTGKTRGQWIQVKADGKSGWIKSSSKYKVTRTSKIFEFPGFKSKLVSWVPESSTVYFLGKTKTEKSNSWWLISYKGKSGWIYNSNYKFNTTIYRITKEVALRESPGQKAKIIQKVSIFDTIFDGGKKNGNWVKVKVRSVKKGAKRPVTYGWINNKELTPLLKKSGTRKTLKASKKSCLKFNL